MFIAVLFIIAKTEKQPTCESFIDWIQSQCHHILTMQLPAPLKSSINLSLMGIWRKLDTIKISQRTQKQISSHHLFSKIHGS
uniref:Uncharacterized protein n=1 Tax=Macaca fascicularis TaxID=9541 RepID=A0A7N9DBL6_MACFA